MHGSSLQCMAALQFLGATQQQMTDLAHFQKKDPAANGIRIAAQGHTKKHLPGSVPQHCALADCDTLCHHVQVLEGLYKSGKARAIGVSNYSTAHVQELLAAAEVKPMVNQVG